MGILDHVHLFRSNVSNKRTAGTEFDELLDFLQTPKLKRDVTFPIKWFQEQIPRRREKRFIDISDPLYPKQWHLHGSPRTHLNVQPAWTKGFMGEGVRIAIVDDGIQSTHPDLKDNVRVESSWNFNRQIQSPDPTYMKGHFGDWHGTSSAGAAAARNDGASCGVGVAPHAELAGVAILQNNAEVGDAVEAQALSFKPQENHIYSNSWGPLKPGTGNHANEKPGPLTAEAISKTIATGRNGLGSIYVWAAGNDGNHKDNCNYDGYASMRYSILVGSTDTNGDPSPYSEPCSAMLAVAPGGLISSNKIVSTDLLGSDGLDQGDCTAYSGTSASCPLAAGMAALALQAHSHITWLELQYILVEATRKHNDHSSWIQNAAGFWHSNNMGFGLLDAEALVVTALRWKENNISVKESILEGSSTDKNEIEIHPDFFVHHVEVDLWSSAAVPDTHLVVKSPSGTVSVLATPHDDRNSRWEGWTFLSRAFHGESSKGVWKLELSVRGRQEVVTKWNIRLYVNNVPKVENQTDSMPLIKATEFRNSGESSVNDYLYYVIFPLSPLVAILIKKMTQRSAPITTVSEVTKVIEQ